MLQHTLIFLGVVALVATTITLRTSDDELAIIGGLAGTLSWALWAYSTLNVVATSGGSEFTYSYPSLALFGLAMAIPNFYVALTGPLHIARDRSQLTEEIQ